MNTHDEVLDQMSGANPLPDVEMITDGQLTEMTVQVEDALRTAHGISPLTLEPANPRITWWRPAAVFAAAVIAAFFVIGVVSLATGGDGDARPAATVPTIAAGPAEREWSDVLAVTQARSQPQVASCRTEPTVGPPMQEKPSHGWKGPLAGVFDSRRGSILYVDSLQETWAFDICNNKWSPLNPEGRPVELPSGGLVYDVDSDVTIAMSHEIAVYNPIDNAWTYPDEGATASPGSPFGAVYDPISGLVITTVYPEGGGTGARVEAWAYDVEFNEWLFVGVVAVEGEDRPWQYDLIGYSADLDRLIFVPSEFEPLGPTLLIDPRSGEREMLWTPTPSVSIRWWGGYFGVGAGTTFVVGTPPDRSGVHICGFDPETLSWFNCYAGPGRPIYGAFEWFGAMVGDPINERLVLIGGVASEARTTDHVWGIDYATGTIVELVPDLP